MTQPVPSVSVASSLVVTVLVSCDWMWVSVSRGDLMDSLDLFLLFFFFLLLLFLLLIDCDEVS